MAIANSFARVLGPTVGFFTLPVSSSGRVMGPTVKFFGKSFSSYDRVPAFTSIFSTDTVAVRVSSFAQRAGTNIGDLIGEIIDTSGLSYAFTLVSLKWSTSRTSGWRPLTILSSDGAYSFPGTGSPSGTAFQIPAEFFQDVSGNVFIQLVISWNAPTTFSGHPTLGNGCLGYWKLDDDIADSNVVDSVGSSTGTLQLVGGGAPQNTSAHSVAGKIAKAFDMNTPSNVEVDLSVVEASPGDIFELSKPFSMSFWTTADSLASVLNVASSVGGPGFKVRQITSGSFFRFEFHLMTNAGNWFAQFTPYLYVVSTYYHVVITYDGSGVVGGLQIFVNAVDRNDSTGGAGSVTTIDNGALFVTMQNPNGPMDEVGLWNRVLSQAEAYGLFTGLLTY